MEALNGLDFVKYLLHRFYFLMQCEFRGASFTLQQCTKIISFKNFTGNLKPLNINFVPFKSTIITNNWEYYIAFSNNISNVLYISVYIKNPYNLIYTSEPTSSKQTVHTTANRMWSF